MVDGKIVVSNPDMTTTLKEIFAKMIDEDSEIITIYVGEEGNKRISRRKFLNILNQLTKDVEVEIHDGKQPVLSILDEC